MQGSAAGMTGLQCAHHRLGGEAGLDGLHRGSVDPDLGGVLNLENNRVQLDRVFLLDGVGHPHMVFRTHPYAVPNPPEPDRVCHIQTKTQAPTLSLG